MVGRRLPFPWARPRPVRAPGAASGPPAPATAIFGEAATFVGMEPTLLELAEDSGVYVAPRPGFARVVTKRYAFLAGTTGAWVVRVRLFDDVAEAVAETRALARDHDQRDVTWWCGELTTPPDLPRQLGALG